MTSSPSRQSDALTADLDRARRTRALVEALIATPSLLGPDFTAIHRLDTLHSASPPPNATPAGWKARGRGTPGTDIADTLALLEQAAKLGLVERLDWAFRAHTFDVAVDSGMVGELHLTPEPETFGSACPPRLAVPILRGRRSLSVCAEIHADAFVDERRLLMAVEEMQSWGWQIVYADVVGTLSAAVAERLRMRVRPAYVQVDLAVNGRATDPAVTRWVELAHEAGAQILALGIDTRQQLEQALALGATYGRGDLLGRPVAVPT